LRVALSAIASIFLEIRELDMHFRILGFLPITAGNSPLHQSQKGPRL
jgi:hypothetical protein